jgi:acyl dehydratase
MRLAIETRPFGPHPLLGLGVDELRWLPPVRPGDVLHLERGEAVHNFTPLDTVPMAA